ncbi:MAG: Crp/Fnr family transcriptional regulator [Dehalococcoidia bacterium]|nr:Crp/Fnr family transcriptional regulator [Dehalococcoidia bacterium]MCB9484567.1 Crp/Fnr family transcriptional regulator [Thermoflexaceae bacterium]
MSVASPEDIRLIPYLSSLSDDESEALARELPVTTYSPREMVLHQGEPVAGVYVTVAGRARLFVTSGDGKEQTLRILTRGDTFAEVPVFDGGDSPATVEALDHFEVIVISRERLRALIRTHPDVADAVLQHFARRLRGFTAIIEQVSLQSVTSRLARYLYQTAKVEGTRSGSTIIVQREVTVHDLATIVGSVREVVTRYLKEFESQGILTISRREFVIHDMGALEVLL